MNNFTLSANIVDITNTNIYAGTITVANGLIAAIHATHATPQPHLPYALPGFVDSHVHVESSLLVPSEFGRLAVVHGTVASISDPHEIANVCGIAGVHYMIENGKTIPFKFHFGAPSCVPATVFETAGATNDEFPRRITSGYGSNAKNCRCQKMG
jgi:adenine deaminase